MPDRFLIAKRKPGDTRANINRSSFGGGRGNSAVNRRGSFARRGSNSKQQRSFADDSTKKRRRHGAVNGSVGNNNDNDRNADDDAVDLFDAQDDEETPADALQTSNKRRRINGDAGLNRDDAADDETADEKRTRLAAQYLNNVKSILAKKNQNNNNDDDDDDASGDDDGGVGLNAATTAQLDTAARELAHVHTRHVAAHTRLGALRDNNENDADTDALWLQGLRSPLTCVTASATQVFAGCKAGHIMQWQASDGRRVHTYVGAVRAPVRGGGHVGAVMCVAVSSDGKWLLSGGVVSHVCHDVCVPTCNVLLCRIDLCVCGTLQHLRYSKHSLAIATQ